MTDKNKKFILIDGNSYVHRAYHAIPKLTDQKGNAVNAVFGFLKMLKKIITQERPDYIFVAFDSGKATFRHKKFNEYKANRQETPDDLISQIPILFEILDAMNVNHLNLEDYEADDIIATLTKKAAARDINTMIVTSDKDIFQLVNDKVIVIDGIKNNKFDSGRVKEKLGVSPKQIIDYLALVGDKSDNLPGVMGIGPVTARQLLDKYETLEGIYEVLGDIKPKVSEKLKKYEKEAFLTKEMVKLKDDIEIDLNLDDCFWKGPDNEKLLTCLRKLNFKSLIAEWINNNNKNSVKIIASGLELERLLCNGFSGKRIAIELVFEENTGELTVENLLGLGLASDDEKLEIYIPIQHRKTYDSGRKSWSKIKATINTILANDNTVCLSYDIKSLYKFCRNEGINISKKYMDIITANYILDPEMKQNSLRNISSKYLSWAPAELKEFSGSLLIEDIAKEVASRLKAVLELDKILRKEVLSIKSEFLLENIELPMLYILAEMELTGISIDLIQMEAMKREFEKMISVSEKDIFLISGEEFNINSSKQLAGILFDKFKLNPGRKTKTGSSTAVDVLSSLKNEHILPGKILEYRKLQKLLSTYIDPLPKMINRTTGKLHTTFNIAGTATGRLASSNPNLQNIPIRTQRGSIIRKAFVPDKGSFFLSADYSQIDLRLLAHISKDNNLINSFKEEKDIHMQTASRIFNIDEESVTDDMRKRAKTINFGIIYGISPRGLARRTDMSINESEEFIKRYFKEFPGIKEYMENTVEYARKHLFVETILNRRRYLPEINSVNIRRKKLFERIAINTPVQGSSADIIKLAMVKLNKIFNFNSGPVRLLLQVHDELLFSIKENIADDIILEIKRQMENPIVLSVPLTVELKRGYNWRDIS